MESQNDRNEAARSKPELGNFRAHPSGSSEREILSIFTVISDPFGHSNRRRTFIDDLEFASISMQAASAIPLGFGGSFSICARLTHWNSSA